MDTAAGGRPRLRLERVGFGHPDAFTLIEAVQQEYVARYGGRDDTPLDAMFDPPLGSFFVGYVDNVPVASGAWRRRDDVTAFGTTRTAEVKRMFVVEAARGAGHARTVLAHLEQSAGESGARAMVLETGLAQPEAIALYESSGYVPIQSFGHYARSPQNRCFAKELVAAGSARQGA